MSKANRDYFSFLAEGCAPRARVDSSESWNDKTLFDFKLIRITRP